MKTTLIALLIAFVGNTMTAIAEEKTTFDLWRLMASSDIIAVGDLSFDAVKGTDEYVILEFKVEEFLKASVPTERLLKVRFYDSRDEHGDITGQLNQLSKTPNLIFLVQVDDPDGKGLYFAGSLSESLMNNTPQVEQAIDRELKLQERITQDFAPNKSAHHFKEVKDLLSSITDVESQRKAFSRLEELGQEAVPAIISQMHDFRELPKSSISLTNSPGHWEGVRHYSPDKVVDALAAILNQITQYSYRDIYNGGSDRERNACINAWRIHLHHIKNNKENKNR